MKRWIDRYEDEDSSGVVFANLWVLLVWIMAVVWLGALGSVVVYLLWTF